MTKTARLILADAKHAIDKHTDDLQGADFRISWLAIVTLLRAVGHGLKAVDTTISPAMKKAIDAKHEEVEKSKLPIFFEFIKPERDRYLKEYEIGVRRSIFATGKILGKDGSVRTFEAHFSSRDGAIIDTNNENYRSAIITDGPFEGQHEKDVALQAYAWWVAYLNDVDRMAGI